ncbi:aromatic amino acid transport family protein [Acidaminococcus sp.]|uniref:aromatic amino acid transport family protein n=1 Tax=Acidaminococcus sp. TaxID=1872103 RepID=UPI0035214987
MEYTESENLETVEEENGTLEVRRLTFTEAVMLVVGATIGSGVLGLAYASRKAGWPVLLTWLLAAGFLSVASMLYVAETALRTRRPLQLSGLAEKYVGKAGSWLIFFSVGATSFCSLIAYITGCGKILSTFLGLPLEEASLLFSIGATAVVWLGLKVTGDGGKVPGAGDDPDAGSPGGGVLPPGPGASG